MVSSVCKYSLSDRWLFVHFGARTYAIAAAIGPLVGGGLAQAGQWRWLFCESIDLLTDRLSSNGLRSESAYMWNLWSFGDCFPQVAYSTRLLAGETESNGLDVCSIIRSCCVGSTLTPGCLSGNVLIIGSSSACSIALTWGGVVYSWRSFRVLVPLLAGLCGFGTFLLYESRVAKRPIVSPATFTRRRSNMNGAEIRFPSPSCQIVQVLAGESDVRC